MGSTKYYSIAIVGAGTAGISIAARILRMAPHLKEKVVLIDPAEKHYYQPLWTLVGGGAALKEDTVRDQKDVIPNEAIWLIDLVVKFYPTKNQVQLQSGLTIHYNYLVVAAGIEILWDKVKGLKEAIGQDGVCSNYSYEYVSDTWSNIEQFNGGTAIFTQPST
ncbi:MAG: FAD/NAD(P)-binding oxidoreductase, partial [Bacillus sp. (in: firmicutes)]